MDLFVLAELLAFGAAGILAGVAKSWVLCLVAAGLFLEVLARVV